jgi:pimeloyl-ACP methyl ester carboxylesterase
MNQISYEGSQIPNLIILGEENEQTLLFIGGWGVPLEAYLERIQKLASNFRVVAFGLSGFGNIAPLPISKSNVKGHTEFFMEKILPRLDVPKSTILIGHSTGAAVAVYLAEHYPERFSRLVLVSPIGNPDPIKRSLMRMIRFADVKEIAKYNISSLNLLSLSRLLSNLMLGANAKSIDLRVPLKRLVERGHKINMILATDDKITPPGDLLTLQGIEIKNVIGGHYWLKNNSEQFLAYMMQFKTLPVSIDIAKSGFGKFALWARCRSWFYRSTTRLFQK